MLCVLCHMTKEGNNSEVHPFPQELLDNFSFMEKLLQIHEYK